LRRSCSRPGAERLGSIVCAAERGSARAGDVVRATGGDGRSVGPPLGPRRDTASLVTRHVPDRRSRGFVIELLPTKASFGLADVVEVEGRGWARPTAVSLWRLER